MWVVVIGIVPLILGIIRSASSFYDIETQARLKSLQIGFYFGIGVALIGMSFMDAGLSLSIGLLTFGFVSEYYQKKFIKIIKDKDKE